MAYFDKNYHPPGTAPGTLTDRTSAGTIVDIRLIDYAKGRITDLEHASLQQCQASLAEPTISWIHFQGIPSPEELRHIGATFGLHPLALEDVLNTGQRPKIDLYDSHLFAVFSIPVMQDETLTFSQVSLFLGQGYVISFTNMASDYFEPLRTRLFKPKSRMATLGEDYLFYTIIDLIIDTTFPVLEAFSEKIETLEDKLIIGTTKESLAQIHRIRRELLLLRRHIWPQREAISSLLRGDLTQIKDENLVYFRDCYDHVIQTMDLIENYRDMAASMIDVYLSSASFHMNEIMRVLTLIATVFIPLTFIVGIYGMNFSADSPWAMPELKWHYGYPLIWLVMLSVAGGMLIFFRRKKWI